MISVLIPEAIFASFRSFWSGPALIFQVLGIIERALILRALFRVGDSYDRQDYDSRHRDSKERGQQIKPGCSSTGSTGGDGARADSVGLWDSQQQ
jgi:hypothetical protein